MNTTFSSIKGVRAEDVKRKRFGKLIAIEPVGRKNGEQIWRLQCDCGGMTEIPLRRFLLGHTSSCGCMAVARVKHGLRNIPEYGVWWGMLQRCNNPNVKKYPQYGGRGIKVCERWSEFGNFISDMGRRPSPKHCIDRIDTNGDYAPGNCRWVTNSENCRNKRNNVRITFRGQTMCLKEWSEEMGIPYGCLQTRIKKGWDAERALTV